MKIIIIIQARMGSERLPGKVLLPLGNSHVLDYVVSRCRNTSVQNVIVATTNKIQDDPIVQWCKSNQVEVFQGSEDDVLLRYYESAKSHQPDYVIRVTSDCPFVDMEQIEQSINAVRKEAADMVIMEGEQPRGFEVELVSFSALEQFHLRGQAPHHREHVTYYGLESPEQFKIVRCQIIPELRYPNLRVTLDTSVDYEVCLAIAKALPDKLVSSSKVVQYLLQNPDVAKINAAIQQKPVIK